MIPRNLAGALKRLTSLYPVVTVTGPRQAGKTTLCQATFPELPYVSLEPLDARETARADPRGFLGTHPQGVVIDEVQHVPELLSYIQDDVDRNPEPGRFILTGSQHFGLSAAISQSLAGRCGVLTLLPPSLDELQHFDQPPQGLLETLHAGAYPRIHDRHIPAATWLADYVTTYVQRDVRQVLNVENLATFTSFIKHCAGRSGQVINLSSLGGDAGVSYNTARSWISVLETSFICFRLPALHRSNKKRLIKAPKLHFFDSGLVCHLLGIAKPEQLRHHPLRGAIFESWVAAEITKARVHQGLTLDLFHYRQPRGLEVDLVLENGASVVLIEAKSGATVVRDSLLPMTRVMDALKEGPEDLLVQRVLVHGGEQRGTREGVELVPWSQVQERDWSA